MKLSTCVQLFVLPYTRGTVHKNRDPRYTLYIYFLFQRHDTGENGFTGKVFLFSPMRGVSDPLPSTRMLSDVSLQSTLLNYLAEVTAS